MAELIVKKYGNRRLYDTEASRYITLDELATLIRQGRDVRVVDAKSGADLTKGVLLQIISDQERDLDLLPTSFLARVIRANDATMREALHRYLTLSFDAFLGAQRELEARYRDLASSFWNPMSWMPGGSAAGGAAPRTPAAPAAAPPAAPSAAPPPEPPPESAGASAAPPVEPSPEPPAEPPAESPTAATPPAAPAKGDDATKAQIAALRSQVEQIQQLLSAMQGKEDS